MHKKSVNHGNIVHDYVSIYYLMSKKIEIKLK